MTLRIERACVLETPGATGGEGDDWGSRIAKLIPAEALGLYGSAVALIHSNSATAETTARWAMVVVCCALTVLIRYRATLDPTTGRPQWAAIGIALVSFILWLAALGGPASPIDLGEDLAFAGPLAALVWGAIVPYVYKG